MSSQTTASLTDDQRLQLETDRIMKTSLGEYDMITVVSQKAINQQLQALWEKENAKAKAVRNAIASRIAKGEKPPFSDLKLPGLVHWDSRTTSNVGSAGQPQQLKPVVTSTSASDEPEIYNPDDDVALEDNYTRLEADMGAPEVQLQLDDYHHFVIYRIHLLSGKFYFFAKNNRRTYVPIEGWKLDFKVNMDLKALVDNAKAPDHIKTAIALQNDNLNDYSIQQLTIDFNTADLANLDDKAMEKMEASGWKNLSVTPQQKFKEYLKTYLAMLKESKGSHELGYAAIKRPKATPISNPTIMPTAVTFSNLAFIGPDGKSFSSASDQNGGGDNMLVYLQTANQKPLPKQALPLSANWLIPSPRTDIKRDGTVCISAANFLDGWLIKKLDIINKKVAFSIDRAAKWGLGDRKEVSFAFGEEALNHNRDIAGHDAQWQRLPAMEQNLNATGHSIARFYRWTFDTHREDHDGTNKFDVDGKCSTWLRVPIGLTNGKCIINFGGYIHVTGFFDGILADTNSTTWIEWDCGLVFDGVDKGELKISMGELNKKEPQEWNDENWWDKGELKGLRDLADKSFREMKLDEIIHDLQRYLNGSWGFVFGGANTFYIDSVMFNKNGDLLATLVYKT